MVVLQLFRTMGYAALGAFKRRQALWVNPQASFDPMEKSSISIYAGMRMADIFSHINNARYLEITEFARWFVVGYSGLLVPLAKERIAFVVASADVHFVREMKPCRFYRVSTEFVSLEDTEDSSATAPRPRDGRGIILHEIWSNDGRVLHASIRTSVAFLGPANSPLAVRVPPNGRRTVPLSCSGVLSQLLGRDAAEVRETIRRNGMAYEQRLGFGSEEKWLDTSQRLDSEWRRKMRGLKTL